jgi:hypothetical protein
MSWIAAAIGGATAIVGASSASKAASAQKDASKAQMDLANRMYDDNVNRASQNIAAQEALYRGTLNSQLGTTQGTLDAQRGVTQQTLEDQLRVAGATQEDQLRTASQYQTNALQSSQQALNAQLGYFDPFYQTGLSANDQMMIEMGLAPGQSTFQTTPGYDYKMNEALGAVEGSAAASGSLMSGATMESLLYTGHGVADQEYDDYLAQLNMMTDRGFAAGTNMATSQANADATRQNVYGNTANMKTNAYGNYGANAYNAYGTAGANNYNAYGQAGANNYNAYGMYGSNMGAANQNTFNALAGAGSEYSANMNNAIANQGNAAAAGYMAPTNALMAGAQAGTALYGYMNTPNPHMQSTSGTVPASSQYNASTGAWGLY